VRDFILSFFLFFATCAFSSKYSEIHRELLSRLLLCLIVFDYVPHMTMIWLLLRLFQKVFFRHKMINVWYMVIGRFVRDLSKSPTLFFPDLKKKAFQVYNLNFAHDKEINNKHFDRFVQNGHVSYL